MIKRKAFVVECFITAPKRELSQWAGERHWNIARSTNTEGKKNGYVIMSSKKQNGGRRDRLGKGTTLQWAFWEALNSGAPCSQEMAWARGGGFL